jgi:hypothetical protein
VEREGERAVKKQNPRLVRDSSKQAVKGPVTREKVDGASRLVVKSRRAQRQTVEMMETAFGGEDATEGA